MSTNATNGLPKQFYNDTKHYTDLIFGQNKNNPNLTVDPQFNYDFGNPMDQVGNYGSSDPNSPDFNPYSAYKDYYDPSQNGGMSYSDYLKQWFQQNPNYDQNYNTYSDMANNFYNNGNNKDAMTTLVQQMQQVNQPRSSFNPSPTSDYFGSNQDVFGGKFNGYQNGPDPTAGMQYHSNIIGLPTGWSTTPPNPKQWYDNAAPTPGGQWGYDAAGNRKQFSTTSGNQGYYTGASTDGPAGPTPGWNMNVTNHNYNFDPTSGGMTPNGNQGATVPTTVQGTYNDHNQGNDLFNKDLFSQSLASLPSVHDQGGQF